MFRRQGLGYVRIDQITTNMLTEHFITAIGTPEKAPGTNIPKDAAIFIHEFNPLVAQRTLLKKSAAQRNCLAASQDHVFTAQAEKAVVHVYSREKGSQEAIVPFTERITCIALACNNSILVLGTIEGRIFLWETYSGRQITTAQSHLQPVTALTVDPTSNFLLSASADSTVHVWWLPSLLSFSNAGAQALTPVSTFTAHRTEVTALATGHSSSFCNIAVSASTDKTCLIWDYHTTNTLRTYLLHAEPLCLALDPADRAVYLGYDDGSVQQLDLNDPADSGLPSTAVENGSSGIAPVQPSAKSRWVAPDATNGPALSVSVSYDGGTLLSGHQTGAILAWDIGRGSLQNNVLQNPLPGPVTNLQFLPVSGFEHADARTLKCSNIVKPKFGAFDNADGRVPGNYSLNVELASNLHQQPSTFEQALTAHTFPMSLLDEGLDELASWNSTAVPHTNGDANGGTDDFMAFDGDAETTNGPSLEEQNVALKAQIEALRRLQTASFDKIDKINTERKALLLREQKRLQRQGVNGTHGGEDEVMDDSSADE